MKQKLYTWRAVDDFISKCIDEGYDIVVLDEGCLGSGHIVMLAPDEKHWNFETKEVPLNCWSSAQTLRRFRKVSKNLCREINKALASE